MELASSSVIVEEKNNPNPFLFILLLIVFIVISVSYVGSKSWELDLVQFHDCFSQNGIREVYQMDMGRFIRFCLLDDGRYIAQETVKIGKWHSEKIYIVDNITDVPGLLIKVYPGQQLKSFVKYVKDLLVMEIWR